MVINLITAIVFCWIISRKAVAPNKEVLNTKQI